MIIERSLPQLVGDQGVFVDGDWVESKDQDPNGDVRLVQLADIGIGKFIDKSRRYMTRSKAEELKCTLLRPGDILLARMPDPIGRACIFPGDEKPCVTVVDICIVRLDPIVVDANWLVHFINSDPFYRQIENRITGTTRKRISRGNLSTVLIPLPPIKEQKRIAAILDKADAIRRKRQQAIELADQFLCSVFLDMFGDPHWNQKSYPLISLNQLITDGPQNGLYEPSSKYGSGTPIVRIDSFYDGSISDLSTLKRVETTKANNDRYQLAENDILINRVNSRSHLGKSALVCSLIEHTIFESNMMRFAVDPKRVNVYFLIKMLQQVHIKNQILNRCKDAVNQSSINQTDVNSLEFPLPPVEDQNRFEAVCTGTQKEVSRMLQMKGNLDIFFDALSQQAFKGKLTEAA